MMGVEERRLFYSPGLGCGRANRWVRLFMLLAG